MMRLLVVTHYYAEHGGGVEITAGELTHRFADRGAEVVWAASGPAGPSPDARVQRLPMRACNVSERRWEIPYPLWGPGSLLRLLAAVRRCDVVHIHDCLYLGSVAAFLAARAAGKPVVVTQHIGLVPYRGRLPRLLMAAANRALGRLLLGGCDRCVFYSLTVAAYFRRFARPAEPAFIPMGVDVEVFRPIGAGERGALRERLGWPLDRPVLLFVGRFIEKKGLELLRPLAGHFGGCEWAFIGQGQVDPGAWGLPNVRCLGFVPHQALAPYYQAADLLVLPSVGEGFPLVVQEAMACGTPALVPVETARAVPGVEGVALVCERRVEALRALLTAALADPGELAQRRGPAAAFARQQWDWEACAARYWACFTALAGKR